MKTPSIALCGRFRSGKDAVGTYLCGKYGYWRFAFGDALKDVCRRLYPEQFADGAKPRALLQTFGQMARTIDNDVWLNACFRQIDVIRRLTDDFKAVITDLRQPNEYRRCRDEGYVIIRISASDAIRLERAQAAGDAFDAQTLTHDTESHIDEFDVDYEITNDDTIEALYAQVDDIMTEVAK